MHADADYPSTVWDGLSSSRSGPIEIVAASPDYQDWDQIVAEVIAAQTEINVVKAASLALTGSTIANVATSNVIGGIPVVHIITVTAATADIDVILTYKTRVTDVVVVKTTANGGSGDTVTLKNGSTAITNAISVNITDTTIARAGTINDASHEIAAGGILRVSGANSTSCACIVYVHGVRVA